MIRFSGTDGSDLATGAFITAIVDGTPASDKMPSRIGLWTSDANSQSPTEHLRVSSNGNITIGSHPGMSATSHARLWIEHNGNNLSSEWDPGDNQGTRPHMTLAGINNHVRLDMGTMDTSPFAGYIQARYDNTPDTGATDSNDGLEPLQIQPRGGQTYFNFGHSTAYPANFSPSSAQGGIRKPHRFRPGIVAVRNIRKQQQSQGFQPYSIRIPGTDTYIEYGRLDPIGMMIGFIADYSTIYNDLNEGDRAEIENNNYIAQIEIIHGDAISTFETIDNIGKFNINKLTNSTIKWSGLKNLDLAEVVSTQKNYIWKGLKTWIKELGYKKNNKNSFHVVAIDYGIKKNILRYFSDFNCKVTVVSCKTSVHKILALKPNGIFLSNGPGDPAATGKYAIEIINDLIKNNLPIFGICLGHQILALALGGKTKKMKLGHRGANHPVKNLVHNKVEITSQNHGFVVVEETLPKKIEVTHKSLFDNTIEGIKLKNKPIFSVQYHPESNPGPQDSVYLFQEFINNMKKNAKKKRY